MNNIKLGIVVVAYKSAQMTIEYIRREMPNVDVPWVCCIVNNSATLKDTQTIADGCGAEIVSLDNIPKNMRAGSVYILPSEENLGFAKGNNLGVKFLTRYFNVDYLLFSNNDIEIKSPDCLSTMIRTLESDEHIGAVGPRIISLDGCVQYPHDNYISPYRQIGWHLFPFLRKKRKSMVENAPLVERESGFTYWVQGSFFVMRTKDFQQVGMFDPNTFLYAEEPILAGRLKTIGKQMYYESTVTVLHYEGGTIVKKHGSKKSFRMAMESNCYYYRKYLGYNPFVVWLYKMTFMLSK